MNSMDNVIELDGVSKVFNGETAVDRVSFKIGRGEGLDLVT